jgi:hypothetical protein
MKTNSRFLITAALALAIAFALSCLGCPARASKEDTTYSEIVNVPGVSKEDLYEKASLWFAEAFKGPEPELPIQFDIPKKSMITASDKNKGTIQANYTFLTDMVEGSGVFQIWLVYSTVDLQVSDGQYKLVFSNPINGAATYVKTSAERKWIYSSTVPLFSKYATATKNVWHDLASALRETVGGTL